MIIHIANFCPKIQAIQLIHYIIFDRYIYFYLYTPTQFIGPWLNGKKQQGCLSFDSSGENLSGINSVGSFHKSGWWWIAYTGIAIMQPDGSVKSSVTIKFEN